VMVEAMACGTPVVGYDDAAIPEVIDRPEIGRLFHELRPEALAAALEDTLALSQQPNTVAACRARAEEFSVDRATSSYLELYDELNR
jgi:glycosyltransferase involved in cell wall biosynthesis